MNVTDHKTSLPSLSLYTLSTIVIFLISLTLRFALLGFHPLNDYEASLALQSLALSQGENTILTGEPGYIALTTVGFFIFGASEFTARFWPALLGSLLVLSPLCFRQVLGRKITLLLAALIAIDPILIGTSRSVDGSALALVGLLAGVGFLLNEKPLIGGLFLGAALAGGPQIWTGVLILAIFLTLGKNTLNHIALSDVKGLTKKDWTKAALSSGISLVMISTSFFTNPVGISMVGSSVASFFDNLGAIRSVPIFGVSAAWLWMELPAFALALWGLVDGLLRKNALTRLLAIWWGLAVILAIIIPPSGLNQLIWMTPPILALAAIKLSDLIHHRSIENRLVFIAETVVVVALVVFSIMNLLALVNNSYMTTEDTRNRIIGTLLPIILLIVLTILLSWGWSVSSTRKGFLAGMLVLLSLLAFSNTWKSAGLGSRPQFELGTLEGYVVGSEPLMGTIADISRWNTGYENRIDIRVVGLDAPSVEWALRDFERVSRDSGYNPRLSPSLILTGIDENITSSTSYRGQKFDWSVKPDLNAMTLKDWIKWAVFRTAPEQKTEIILWARNDLFSGAPTP